MNKLTIFENTDFGIMRTIEENGTMLFCGSDAAKALGYVKPQNAIDTHCRYALKRSIPHPQSPEKTIEMLFIPESDLYRLMVRSKLPGADKFESWIFDEILASVMKTGSYSIQESNNNLEPLDPLEPLVQSVVSEVMSYIPFIISETVETTLKSIPNNKSEETTCSGCLYRYPKSKVETFPPEIQEMVNRILEQMKVAESFNFSWIAKLCTAQGCRVTSPTIKKYYDDIFSRTC